MVGAPSSRGCEACRRQKKKCNEAQPSCSRCARLRIPCVGAGQRRYKFQHQTVATIRTTLAGSAGSSPVAAVQFPADEGGSLLAPPSNDMTMTTSRLMSALEVPDPRFDLSVYGGFVKELPRRLGTNEALDSAVVALTTILPVVQTRQQSAETFHKYGLALRSLRECLGDPVKARSPDTLCALYLTVICQGWMGSPDNCSAIHGEAIAHILNIARPTPLDGSFERSLRTTLCVLVIFESFVNPRIQIPPDLWGLPETFGPISPADEQSRISSLSNRNLAHFTALIREPELHLLEIHSTYQRVYADCAKMKAILAQIPVVLMPDGRLTTPLPARNRALHVAWQTGYGILLFMVIVLNAVQRAYGGVVDVESLETQSAGFVADVLALSEQAMQYRPLGASATPVYLVAAYAVLGGKEPESAKVEAILAEYQTDFNASRWIDIARSLRARLRSPRPNFSKLLQADYETVDGRGKDPEDPAGLDEYLLPTQSLCCIL